MILLLFLAAGVQARDWQCDDTGETLLWKLQAAPDDLEQSIELYIFGSVHVGHADFYPLPDVVEKAFRGADYLVLETDVTAVNGPSVMTELQSRGQLPAGQSLEELLDESTYTRLEQAMKAYPLSLDMMKRLQPWLVSLMLTALEMNRLGYAQEHGVEHYLLEEKTAGTQLHYLETLEEQLGLLETLNNENYLRYTLADIGGESDTVERLMRGWYCANEETLTNLLFPGEREAAFLSDDEAEQLHQTLFLKRNRTMSEDIIDLITASQAGGRYFVTVGAGHLLGERNIIDLLGAGGYSLERVHQQSP